MSHICLQSTRKDGFAHVTRLTKLLKNKYSKLYMEHQGRADKGLKPPQDFHKTEKEFFIESVEVKNAD